jgi:radical SAM enzyme (TIGR01210 family)
MCGYISDTDERVGLEELIKQLNYAVEKHEKFDVVKIFTSGSFFDDGEIPEEFRKYVYDVISKRGVKKLIVESRPEFIKENVVDELSSQKFVTEVGIGLETANDFVRKYCINKGFTFEQFKKAAELLKKYGIRVKVYLLLKPPFLSEREAIEDVVESARAVKDYADVVSVNLTNIPSATYIEKLWQKGMYRSPWLWSAVEALKRIKGLGVEVVSDPVAAGKRRSVHNCGKCDSTVANAIRKFSLTQNPEDLKGLYCDCIHLWKKVVELEDFSRVPLVL